MQSQSTTGGRRVRRPHAAAWEVPSAQRLPEELRARVEAASAALAAASRQSQHVGVRAEGPVRGRRVNVRSVRRLSREADIAIRAAYSALLWVCSELAMQRDRAAFDAQRGGRK